MLPTHAPKPSKCSLPPSLPSADALEGAASDLPGYASFAAAAANKGTPLRSGITPAPSGMWAGGLR